MVKIPYIHFTDDQKRRAGEVDLEQFLLRQGERRSEERRVEKECRRVC